MTTRPTDRRVLHALAFEGMARWIKSRKRWKITARGKMAIRILKEIGAAR